MEELLAPEATNAVPLAVASGKTCLLDLYDEAVNRGAMYAADLDDIPEEEFKVQAVPRPPGYGAQTVLHFGKMGVTLSLTTELLATPCQRKWR